MAQPIILIVPGGFIKPESYDATATELRQLGYKVIVPALTVYGDLTSETADSQVWKDLATKSALDDVKMIHSHLLPVFDEGKEAVVIGHSYGSVPAMLSVEGQTVDERQEKGQKGGIKAFVSLAGFGYPARGKNILGTDDDIPPMPYHILEAGILQLQDEAKPLFFSDLSPEAQDAAWANVHKTQSHESLKIRPNFIEADIQAPKYYIKTSEDQTVVPMYQQVFVQNGKFNDEFELPSGHCPTVSMPDKFAAIIDTIAKR